MSIPEPRNETETETPEVQRWTPTPAGRRYVAVHRLTGVWPDHLAPPEPTPDEVQRWTRGLSRGLVPLAELPSLLAHLAGTDRDTLEEWVAWIADGPTEPDPAP